MRDDDTVEASAASEVLIPLEQDAIPFYGRELIAVRLADGRIAAVLRWLCEGLGLNIKSQLPHIRGRAVLAKGLVTVRVQTDGGPQPMPAMTLDMLPGWLFTVDERRVKPEVRGDVLRYQSECAHVLGEHFARKERREIPPPSTLVPSEPIARPVEPGEGAPLGAWREYHRAMLAFIDWQEDIETWRGTVESRLEGVEELARIVPELLDRLGPQTLTAEHQRTIQNLAKRLHDMTGYAYSTIYGELIGDFHVPRYTEIAEARWEEVGAWFQVRFDAAQKRSGTHGQH